MLELEFKELSGYVVILEDLIDMRFIKWLRFSARHKQCFLRHNSLDLNQFNSV